MNRIVIRCETYSHFLEMKAKFSKLEERTFSDDEFMERAMRVMKIRYADAKWKHEHAGRCY